MTCLEPILPDPELVALHPTRFCAQRQHGGRCVGGEGTLADFGRVRGSRHLFVRGQVSVPRIRVGHHNERLEPPIPTR
jgi:hypothetical protein